MGSAYFDAHSLWQQSEKPLFTGIAQNLECDTCIVGAGIAGLTTAYLLRKAGQNVVVLDRERLGLGETGLTSAHLSDAIDDRYFNLQKVHGTEGAKLAAESHAAAISLIEQIQAQEGIECEFKYADGYLFLDPKHDVNYLMQELKATHEVGMSGVKLLPRAPVALFDSGPCLHFPRQAQFHPMKYLDGLAYRLRDMGVQILTHSEVVEVKGGKEAYVRTSQGFKVTCANIVVATNTPINDRVVIHTKNHAYRSYIIGVPVPHEKVQDVLLWDTADPYHYVRFVKDPATDEDILLVGGEDHRTGQDSDPDHHFENLRRWVERHLDIHARVVTRWSGQIMETLDGLAYIGRNPMDEHNVYIITGDSGHGLTHGTLGGILIRDLITGVDNPWAKIYDPSRVPVRTLGTYVKEAAQSTIPYGDWLSDGDVDSSDQIEAGEGAVIRDGFGKTAVYKDELQRLHCFSAVCPHLGGIVRWNSSEKTWDCPCHGSRFDRFGQVINGPAISALSPVGDPAVPQEEIEGLTPSP